MNKALKLLIVLLMLGLFLVKTDTTNAQVQCWGGKSWSDDRVRCSSVGGVPVCEHYTVSGYEPCSWTFNCGWMYQDYIQDCMGLPSSCSVYTFIVDDMIGSSGCCVSNCNGKICGESGGCGVTCSTAGYSQWSAWSCGSCNINPGGCGTVPLYQTCTRTNACGGTQSENRVCGSTCNECGPYGSQNCGNWTQTYDCRSSVSGCRECGPYISAWSAWSACSPTTFTRTRTRTCSEDCGTDNCSGVSLSETENCRGTISGTLFDASTVSNCSTMASQPKIEGAGVTLTAQVNHSSSYTTTTNVNGAYTRGNLPVPDSYNLTYTVDENLWVANPPKLLCDGALTGISLSTQGQVVTRRVGLYRIFGGWFQTQGGDMSSEEGITVTIPSTCVLAANQASCGSVNIGGTIYTPLVRNLGADSGMIFSPVIDIFETPNAITTSNERSALSSYQGRVFDYGYYYAQTGVLPRESWNGSGKPAASEEGIIYLSSGNIVIGSDWNMGGGGVDEKLFIIHNGNVTITSNINVETGSYLGIVASGSINFASNVTRVEGVYMADALNIASTGNEGTEQQFVGEGTFVGWSSVSLNRDRGIVNNTAPSELFIFRPDFVIEAFDGVRLPITRWQEIEG